MSSLAKAPGLALQPCAVVAPAVSTRYVGPLITDTSIPGEGKSNGIIPGHPGGGAVQVARNRWAIFFATLDPIGWDCNRSIMYQLRRDAPDGALIAEGVIDRGVHDWDPLGRGDRFVKSCGMPIAFGVPRGATHHGAPLPNSNVFVVKWYRWAHLRDGDRILRPGTHLDRWPQGLDMKLQTLRVEWAQLRLNDAEDDLEVAAPPAMLRQRGYAAGEAFCALGPALQMNHAMKAPVAEDGTCQSWISVDTFAPYDRGHHDHGTVAPVRFRFNARTGLYEWTDTGLPVSIADRVVGEASVNHVAGRYVVSLRCFEYEGRGTDTCWFGMQDLFGDWGSPTFTPASSSPRVSFTCGDGALRLFGNADASGDGQGSRATLACWDVNPQTFKLNNRRILVDAGQQRWPFSHPFVDMAKLCPAQGRRQLLLFRVIDRSHTAPEMPMAGAAPEAAGIHAVEFTYAKAAPTDWTFSRL